MIVHDALAVRFRANLTKIRGNMKMGQREFAKLLGVSNALIGFYETGKKKPGLDTLEMIAKKLKKKPLDLLR